MFRLNRKYDTLFYFFFKNVINSNQMRWTELGENSLTRDMFYKLSQVSMSAYFFIYTVGRCN